MALKTVYVTVGTTKFPELVNEVVSHRGLLALQKRGCAKLVIQYGQSRPVDDSKIQQVYGIQMEQYDYKHETPRSDIINADLVIGHAGAGTCMDILHHGRPGIVVINAKLLDNHQKELAQQLCEDGYLYSSSVDQLVSSIERVDLSNLKPYEKGNNMEQFVTYLSEMMSRHD
ncbi:UDP-N-acetylglucosamine transferase subunit ALG13 [Eurosta solidaginis]|uniref:UDP-N-acetylglucosamine transferase subunit ALG13 n=1 Tax=Eurosta solidaginis TaxID=178769 RepID=UPI0035315BD1